MGNRAVITFDKNPNKHSLGIYLHWNGGAESVLAFLEAADKLHVRDDGDMSYQLARVAQIIGNFFGGTTSVGVGQLFELDCDNGNNGTFKVSRLGGQITIEQSKNGVNGWTKLDLDEIRKHAYWHPKEGEKSILENVLDANKEHFKNGD